MYEGIVQMMQEANINQKIGLKIFLELPKMGNEFKKEILYIILKVILIKIVCLLIGIAYYTVAERKIMASVQRRVGPSIVGIWGLLQPLADGGKLILKELILPTRANK
jgi:NADH:ubiquinone oxidoreductase subunit H